MTRSQFASVRAIVGAIVVVSIIAMPVVLAAQAPQPLRPTVFVHGLGNSSATWQQTADRLAQDLAIAPHRPGLSSFALFGTQSQQLRNYINAFGLSSTVPIGESNGGLVSRKANADGQPFDGVVTAATPHAGAELARSVVNRRVTNFAEFVAFEIAAPFAYYAFYWDRWSWIAYGFANIMFGAVLVIDDRADQLGWLSSTVLPEMYPGSEFLAGANGLNSPSNLSREAAALPRRVGITSEIDPATGYYGIPWRAIFPADWRWITAIQYHTIFVFLMAFEYYANYWDYEDPDAWAKRNGAFLWLFAASAVAMIDPMWCNFIGARSASRACEPSDGIVPVTSQTYPSGTRTVRVVGPTHLEVPRSSDVQEQIALTLVNDFNVRRRVAGVSASPASLSLTPGQSATVTATAVDRFGNPEFVPIAWETANGGIATVNQSGVVTGVASGNTTITAWAYNFSRAVPVTVATAQSLSAVNITGPHDIASGSVGQWTATPVGGVAPFTYTWRVNTTQVQSGTSATLYRRLFADAQLSVVVTDSQGQTRSDTHTVFVEEPPSCGTQKAC